MVIYSAKLTLNILNPLLFSMVGFMFINTKVKAEDCKAFPLLLSHKAIDDMEKKEHRIMHCLTAELLLIIKVLFV